MLCLPSHGYTVTYGIGGGVNPPDEGRLVFNKYGDTYYLSEVWKPGDSQGGALAKSKTEREIARTTRIWRASPWRLERATSLSPSVNSFGDRLRNLEIRRASGFGVA